MNYIFENTNDLPSKIVNTEVNNKNGIKPIKDQNSFVVSYYNDFIISNSNVVRENNENYINKRRLNYIEDKIEPIFISLLKSEEISLDYSSPAEKLFLELLNENSSITLNWLNSFYVKYFTDEKIHMNILRLIGNLKEEQISSLGILIATSALCNKNVEIKELGMRAFENWGSLNSFNVLSQLDIQQQWLNDYRNQVIKDISKNYGLLS
ncbi:hypothetical protein D3C87_1338970 [compost metagenome]